MSERYPLEAARELRERAVDEAGEALAAAVRAHAEASQAHSRACAKLEAHEVETRAFVEAERQAGPRRIEDFQHAQAYLTRRRTEREAHVAAIARAADEVTARERDVVTARDALATAKAEAQAVEKHHERWQDERRKRAEARAEDEVEDLVSARHGRK
ncbi:MAG: hypothetical protein H6722_10395 [Sandaracinus sp.]|nr:hypothetical protein [Sandaracinus sp.]MCB9618170.1 hypothetical protein [Sandaracinus sp.]